MMIQGNRESQEKVYRDAVGGDADETDDDESLDDYDA